MEYYSNTWSFLIFLYGGSIILWYMILGAISLADMRKYLRKNKFINYRVLLSSPLAPKVSLIAPAYNEEKNIVENVKSLLAVQYNKLELIIVNDGSKDNTLKNLINSFSLVRSNKIFEENINTRRIRGIYVSTNPALDKLFVIDKENGGKADALNAGLNFSTAEYVACLDVDSIVEPDALLKMVKPFLEDETVIATGGVVRIANSCRIEDGRLIKPIFPKKLLPRFQVIEYLRAFLLSRLAWSKLNGLMLISGAFGMFKKEIMVNCGGYRTDTVGEDFELVVRMRRYMHENNRKYKVNYIPDPLCWTEAPATAEILGKQRRRWTRGTIETLKIHRKIAFNPRYGILGCLSYPFWAFFEWLAPIFELAGIVTFLFLVIAGKADLGHFLSMLLLIYSFAVLNSTFALLSEELSFHKYARRKDLIFEFVTVLLEPILYHPLIVYWSLAGNIEYLRGVKNWGEMTRTGLSQSRTQLNLINE